jgi:hypothetical protein
MKKLWIVLFLLLLLTLLGGVSSASAAAPMIQFEGFLFPDNVIVETNQTLTFCLINQGNANELVRAGRDDDHLTLSIPIGSASSDLEVDGTTFECNTTFESWECSTDIGTSSIVVTFGPSSTSVDVPYADTVCFELSGVQVNAEEGLSMLQLEQYIGSQRALPLLRRPLVVLKTWTGGAAGDADTLDGKHASDFLSQGTALLGDECVTPMECDSGYCVDGYCCDGPCDKTCESCALSIPGVCSPIPAGTDPDRECLGSDPDCGAKCDGNRRCEFPIVGTDCGICKVCDGTGRCVLTPPDDDDCGIIDCDELDSQSRDYHDLQVNRCNAFGMCKAANDPATCTSYTDLQGP